MIQSGGIRNLINFLLFQGAWLLCVLFPGVAAAAVALVLVLVHLMLVSQAPASEFRFIVAGTVLGSLVDGIWFRTGIMTDAVGSLWTPVWLVGIWAMFMTTLAHSLSWMRRHWLLPLLLAPIAGPFAYWSASQLGAVHFPDLSLALIALAVGWLTVFPLLLFIRQRFYPELAS